MTTLREAAQQALEALEEIIWNKDSFPQLDAITALRAALAEPVQAPVAWWRLRDGKLARNDGGNFGDDWMPLYTATPQRKSLTDEVIAELWYKNGTHHHHFARAIERWLKQQ